MGFLKIKYHTNCVISFTDILQATEKNNLLSSSLKVSISYPFVYFRHVIHTFACSMGIGIYEKYDELSYLKVKNRNIFVENKNSM